MLEQLDPVPTGLITALLARSQVRGSAVTERIGPSPRQMRELTEGRGQFSPYKLNKVEELTGVPENRIRAAQGLIMEITNHVHLQSGELRAHPRLGEVTILETGLEVTVRTREGHVVEGIHPVSFEELRPSTGLASPRRVWQAQQEIRRAQSFFRKPRTPFTPSCLSRP